MKKTTSNTCEAFEALKTFMIENCNAKIVSGGKEILKRCHFCGDSRDSGSAHLYIGMRNNAIVYNCFKCNSSGFVDARFLRDLGCYDTGLISLCVEQNKNAKGSSNNMSKSSSYTSKNIRRVNNLIIPYSNDEYSIKKLGYLSRRIGVDLGLEDAVSLRVVLNLKDFLSANNINNYTRHPDIVDAFSKFFIGFLTTDGSYVILRRVIDEGKLDPSIDKRYINYNIFNQEGNKYYTIPATIDANKRITIRISEGIFDIISVMCNITGRESNTIFCAANGKGYLSMISHLINTYGLVGFDLDVYMDNDVDKREEDKIVGICRVFANSIKIHHNIYNGEKDFGVPKDRIIDSIIERQ